MEDDYTVEGTDEEYENYLLSQLKVVTDPNRLAYLQNELDEIQGRIVIGLYNKQTEEVKKKEVKTEEFKKEDIKVEQEIKKETKAEPISKVFPKAESIAKPVANNGTYFTARGGKKERAYRQDSNTNSGATEKEFSFFAKLLQNRHIGKTFRDKSLYIYNGKVYERDEKEVLAYSFIQEYADEFEKEIDDALVTKAIGVWKRRTTERYYTREELLFDNRFHLCLENGIYCIDKQRLIGFDPHIFLTVSLPIIHDPSATCPQIKEIVKQIVCRRDAWNMLSNEQKSGMSFVEKRELWGPISEIEQKKINTIFEIFGYCLYADYFKHYLFLFQGPNDSGKGTLMKFLKRILGEQGHASVSLQDFSMRFMPASLNGKYANICGDLSIERLKDTGIIKRLIGEDMITTEYKFYDSFQFLNYAKLIASLNDYFEISERDLKYLVKKIWLIECENVFPEVSNFTDSVMTDQEVSGLFNESMNGLKRLLTNQDFSWKPEVDYVFRKFPIYDPNANRHRFMSESGYVNPNFGR